MICQETENDTVQLQTRVNNKPKYFVGIDITLQVGQFLHQKEYEHFSFHYHLLTAI